MEIKNYEKCENEKEEWMENHDYCKVGEQDGMRQRSIII